MAEPERQDEWRALDTRVPLLDHLKLRVELAEERTKAVESRTDIKFAQVAHDAEISRLLHEAKFKEHNTALEQNAKLAASADLAREKQAIEFARKESVDAVTGSLTKQVEDMKLDSREKTGISKGNETLKAVGMLIVGAIIAMISSGVLFFITSKLGAK